jgi:hypothetical protein
MYNNKSSYTKNDSILNFWSTLFNGRAVPLGFITQIAANCWVNWMETKIEESGALKWSEKPENTYLSVVELLVISSTSLRKRKVNSCEDHLKGFYLVWVYGSDE